MQTKLDISLGQLSPSTPFKGAIIDVCDTVDFAKMKLKELDMPFTAADVVALTGLIVKLKQKS